VKRGRLRTLAVAGALALCVALGLAWMEFDSPRLGRALLARAGAAAGATLEAKDARVSLVRGIALREVRASGTYPGGHYELTLERLVFEHRLLPLLRGELAVDRIRVDRPVIRLDEGRAAPVARPTSTTAGALPAVPLRLHVSKVTLDDGTLELRAAGAAPVTVRGLDVELADLAARAGPGSLLSQVSGRGTVHIAEIALARTRVQAASGTLRLEQGRVTSPDVRFQTEEGPFTATWSADLRHLPFSYTLALDGAPLDLNAALGRSSGPGRLGPARLRLDGRGVGPEARGLAGKGVLRLDEGTLPSSPLLVALEQAVGRTHFVGSSYRAGETPFRIDDGRVSFEGFRLDTDAAGIVAGGWTGLDGALEVTVGVRTPRAQVRIAEVPEDVFELLTDAEGFVNVPLRVTGTRERPRIAPDVGALLALARAGGARALAGRARDRLRELLRKPE
jgi:hypothetical protein